MSEQLDLDKLLAKDIDTQSAVSALRNLADAVESGVVVLGGWRVASYQSLGKGTLTVDVETRDNDG